MDFNLDTDAKRRITEHALHVVESDLYRELLSAGVEPEEFSTIEEVDTDAHPDFITYRLRIEGLIARKQQIQEKLANLS